MSIKSKKGFIIWNRATETEEFVIYGSLTEAKKCLRDYIEEQAIADASVEDDLNVEDLIRDYRDD